MARGERARNVTSIVDERFSSVDSRIMKPNRNESVAVAHHSETTPRISNATDNCICECISPYLDLLIPPEKDERIGFLESSSRQPACSDLSQRRARALENERWSDRIRKLFSLFADSKRGLQTLITITWPALLLSG